MQRFSNYWSVGKKIVCIGRNYADHAKGVLLLPLETNFTRTGQRGSQRQGSPIVRPSPCQSLHHEVELGVIIGKGGKKISPKDALSHIAGYTVALDMTARDLQDIEKKKGAPWTEGKCWDTFCAIGDFIPVNEITNPQTLDLWLKVNDTIKQKGNTNDMIFPIPEIIAHVSSIMTLEEGDLILTGTPAGVSEVKPGDIITAGIQGLNKYDIKFSIVQE